MDVGMTIAQRVHTWREQHSKPHAPKGQSTLTHNTTNDRMTTSYGAVLPPDAALPVRDEGVSLRTRDELLAIERIHDLHDLAELQDEWFALEYRFTTPLLTHHWYASCAQALGTSEATMIMLVRSLLELKAVAPLCLRGTFWPRVEILGNHVTDEPSGFLFADQQSLAALVAAILDLRLPVYLKCMRFGSPEARIIEETAHQMDAILLAKEEAIPWVRTEGTWEEFEHTISSSRRSSIRRLQRLLEAKGAVSYDVVTPSPQNVEMCLSELYDVEASSWKARAGTALKTYEELGRFFRHYSSKEAQAGRLRIFFLRVNGRTIAGQLAVVHSKRLWIFKIGHDESWSSHSPGVLLMHRAMKYCFEEKLDGCELLGHDEPWLHIWPIEFHSVVSYRIYRRTLDFVVDLLSDAIEVWIYRIGKFMAKHKRNTP